MNRFGKPLSAFNNDPSFEQVVLAFVSFSLALFVAFGVSMYAPVESMPFIAMAGFSVILLGFFIVNHFMYWHGLGMSSCEGQISGGAD